MAVTLAWVGVGGILSWESEKLREEHTFEVGRGGEGTAGLGDDVKGFVLMTGSKFVMKNVPCGQELWILL